MRKYTKSRQNSALLKHKSYTGQPYYFEYRGNKGYWGGRATPYTGPVTWYPVPSSYVLFTLTDTISGWNGKKTEFHPVTHTREQLVTRGEPSWCYGPNPNGDFEVERLRLLESGITSASFSGNGRQYKRDWSKFNGLVPAAPSLAPPPLDWRHAYERLLDDINGLLPAQKAIAVNVAEFSQLKRLVPSLAKPISRLMAWMAREPNRVLTIKYKHRTRRGKIVRRTKRVTVSSGRWNLRDLAQIHLATTFGVMPLADDLGDFAGKFHESKLHLSWFRTFATGERKVARSMVQASDQTTSEIGAATWYSVTKKTSCAVLGVLGCHVRVTPESGAILANRLIAQILGLNVPLQIAWELVPFSFVVDWFLPVGELLDRFDPKRHLGSLAARVEILDRWHTVKTVSSDRRDLASKLFKLPMFGRTNQSYVTQPASAERRDTSYIRSNGWPKFNLVPPRKGRFRLKELGVTLSLLVQKLIK